MNIQCYICHEAVRVPVRFTCFPCENKPGQSTCNSIMRVCLMCAREYLQLNKRRSERVVFRKCLTCPAKVRCADLSAINSYEKDFLIMSYDGKIDYPCFHIGCDFKGTQNELDSHIQKECKFRIISCRFCHIYYRAIDETEHVFSCAERFGCEFCEKRLAFCEKSEHYSLEHSLYECRYCYLWVDMNTVHHHSEICPERPRECVYCKEQVTRQQMYDHLTHHIELFQTTIYQNNRSIDQMLRILPTLLTECKKYI